MKYRIAFVPFLFQVAAVMSWAQSVSSSQPKSTPNATYSESLSYTPFVFGPAIKPKSDKDKKPRPSKSDSSTSQTTDASSLTIPVSVFDVEGHFVLGLTKADIEVFIDNEKQDILAFDSDDEALNIIFLIDTSPSIAYSIEEIQKFLTASLTEFRTRDEISVIKFDGETKVLIDSSNDKDAISKAIRKLKFGDGTSLYEAIENVVKKNAGFNGRPKTILVLTDAVDTTSQKSDYNKSLLEAQKSDSIFVPVYIDTFQANLNAAKKSSGSSVLIPGIGKVYGSAPVIKEEYELGKKYLTDLFSLTGGRAYIFQPASSGASTTNPNILRDLRTRYTVTIKKPESNHAGEIKQIRVRVNRPNLTVFSKSRLAVVTE